ETAENAKKYCQYQHARVFRQGWLFSSYYGSMRLLRISAADYQQVISPAQKPATFARVDNQPWQDILQHLFVGGVARGHDFVCSLIVQKSEPHVLVLPVVDFLTGSGVVIEISQIGNEVHE